MEHNNTSPENGAYGIGIFQVIVQSLGLLIESDQDQGKRVQLPTWLSILPRVIQHSMQLKHELAQF